MASGRESGAGNPARHSSLRPGVPVSHRTIGRAGFYLFKPSRGRKGNPDMDGTDFGGSVVQTGRPIACNCRGRQWDLKSNTSLKNTIEGAQTIRVSAKLGL
jgi:hypothetical protein